MKSTKKTIEFRFERNIPAPPAEVFTGWLDPKVPGTPWNMADKLLLNPQVDGFFYWTFEGTPHYGRFTKVERSSQLEHTWMSPNTLGWESKVTVTFKPKGEGTLMTLVHSGLPDTEAGRGHEKGWNYFLNLFPEGFGGGARRKKK